MHRCTAIGCDETSTLLLSRDSNIIEMEPPRNDVESGYGTSEVHDAKSGAKSGDNCSGYPNSSDTCSSLTNDHESQEGDIINHRHSWMLPFFVNIFLACASFSMVRPSLAPYILDIGAPLAFLPYVVSSYSVGEMLGSVALGHFYECATKTYETVGRGPKLSMMICLSLGVIGSAMYAAAGWVGDEDAAKYCLLLARLIQGIWTGGQQAVEQAYLSAAVHPSKRTEYTATLSTCAVLGFVMGPTIGALLSLIDTTIFGLPVNADNSAGIFMLVATSFMFIQTALFFDGKDDTTGLSADDDKECIDDTKSTDSIQKNAEDMPFNVMGISMCMVIFYVLYYSFAVQETITTPLVMLLYGWSPLDINLLFTGAGIISLVTAFSMRYLTRYVEDRVLLMASILIGFVGSAFLMDLPFSTSLPVWRFLLGFSLVTIAFPIGRNSVLGIFGNVLGEVNQGRWTGIILAVSAFPRVIGPFVSLELLTAVDWKTWLEFGICAAMFGITFLATWRHIGDLVPHSDYAKGQNESDSKDSQPLVTSLGMPPSPILGKSH